MIPGNDTQLLRKNNISNMILKFLFKKDIFIVFTIFYI